MMSGHTHSVSGKLPTFSFENCQTLYSHVYQCGVTAGAFSRGTLEGWDPLAIWWTFRTSPIYLYSIEIKCLLGLNRKYTQNI